jgi:hypothetical protein
MYSIMFSGGAACGGTACDQVETAENILDNFCRADFGRLSTIK